MFPVHGGHLLFAAHRSFFARAFTAGFINIEKTPESVDTPPHSPTAESACIFTSPSSGWDIGERQEMVTLKGHSDIVMGMMVMHELDNLVSASLDTSIRVWDTYTQKPVQTLLGHNKVRLLGRNVWLGNW